MIFRNVYDHGIGFLEVRKILDGFPDDWGIDDTSTFYVRIFDLDADNGDGTFGNYLLFYPDILTASRGDILGIPDIRAFDNTYWCVGNHALGLTHFYPADMIPILEIPLYAWDYVRLSNLWTGIRYEVREVRRADETTAAEM